jgi:hypothetical protein
VKYIFLCAHTQLDEREQSRLRLSTLPRKTKKQRIGIIVLRFEELCIQ